MGEDIRTLDGPALATWLEAALPGFRGPLKARKFSGGQSNPTYLVEAVGRRCVLRRKPPGTLLKSAHAVDREYRVLQALHGGAVPVARPLALCADDSVIGSMFYLMDYVEGRIFWDPALPELVRERAARFYMEMVRVLAAIHDVDLAQAGLEDFGHPGNYFERQTNRWTRQYRAAETEPIEAMEYLMEWLPAHLPPDDGQVSLIHGDYRIDNLIFDPGEPACARSWTGNFRPWVIPLRTWPTSACSGVCRPTGSLRAGRHRSRRTRYSARGRIRCALLRAPRARGNTALGVLPGVQLFRFAAILQGVLKRAPGRQRLERTRL